MLEVRACLRAGREGPSREIPFLHSCRGSSEGRGYTPVLCYYLPATLHGPALADNALPSPLHAPLLLFSEARRTRCATRGGQWAEARASHSVSSPSLRRPAPVQRRRAHSGETESRVWSLNAEGDPFPPPKHNFHALLDLQLTSSLLYYYRALLPLLSPSSLM